jgi:hypothetical protein
MDWTTTILDVWARNGDGREVAKLEEIQALWSGYGQIVRLIFNDDSTIICKVIAPSVSAGHPRGWDGDISHRRKVHSYQVERSWYQNHKPLAQVRWPKCFGQGEEDGIQYIWLEDLDAVGYGFRRSHLDEEGLNSVLRWLGTFHGATYNASTEGLWQQGTYWHLETRPDELQALEDLELKKVASELDQRLFECPHRSFVHGDAKVANFCFSHDNKSVAAVDFQYIGGGVGVQDLAYFFGSCCDENSLEQTEPWVLDQYFGYLRESLQQFHSGVDVDGVERAWRELYDVAWTDFHRFLKGWSPGHWKLNSYSEKVKTRCLNWLKGQK